MIKILLSVCCVVCVACGGNNAAPTSAPSPSSEPTEQAPQAVDAPAPADPGRVGEAQPIEMPKAEPPEPGLHAPQPGGATSDGFTIVKGDAPCKTDADCVPTSCCHAASCGARADAPTCTKMLCTMDCRPNTMDCGGRCLCQDGVCAAKISAMDR